jgi:hypothetical protein
VLAQQIAKYLKLKMFNNPFDTIPRRIRNNKFLQVDQGFGDKWAGMDTKERYAENLKTQPDDWYYRNNTVQYKYNSDGYRTKEFKDVDWENSIVMFGCSVVNGVGVDECDTVPSRLEELLGTPVINMGIGGGSMLLNLHNLSILQDGYPTPKGIVVIWPSYRRIVEYHRSNFYSYGAWDSEPNTLMDVWFKNNNHAIANAMFMSKISRSMWKDKCKYLEYTWCHDTSKILKCKKIPGNLDWARDLGHPGIKTNKAIAKFIEEELKNV